MTKSIISNTPLSVDELTLVLVCMSEVNITDAPAAKRDLQARLTKKLMKMAPDHYEGLIRIGNILPIEELDDGANEVMKKIARRIMAGLSPEDR